MMDVEEVVSFELVILSFTCCRPVSDSTFRERFCSEVPVAIVARCDKFQAEALMTILLGVIRGLAREKIRSIVE